jgi:monovalent cation/hydrogen antiporter
MRLFTGAHERCEHVPEQAASPRGEACEDCGSRFNLRVCAECGYVGCCESQLGHDRDHAMDTGHAVIRSLPLSKHSFTWCYACHRYV